MPHAQHVRMILPLAISVICVGAFACSGGDPELNALPKEQAQSAPPVDTTVVATDGSGIEGTWMGPDTVEQIQMLVLMTDGRYHMVRDVPCAPDDCNPAVERDGTYEIYVRGETRVLGLSRPDSRVVEPFEYVLEDRNTLKLRPLVAGEGWFTLNRAGFSWCSESRDCNVQSLPPGICAGGYDCTANKCVWRCGRPLPVE